MTDNQQQKSWRESIQSLMHNTPEGYREKYLALRDLRRIFHQELASALTPSFNRFVDESPQDSLVQKKKLATSINADLRGIGCAIRCDKTGLPGILAADVQSIEQSDVSRFRLIVVDDKGKTHRTLTVKYLPYLTLRADTERTESLARDARKDQKRGSGRD